MGNFTVGQLYTSSEINRVLLYTGITVDSIYLLYKPVGTHNPMRFLFEEIVELENFHTQERTYRLHGIDRGGVKKFFEQSKFL